MTAGGRTPEELETLMEDAHVLGDGTALSQLFEAHGVFVLDKGKREARGRVAIAEAMEVIADKTSAYIAQPRVIFQNDDLALLIGDGVINVARRGHDRSWLFAISFLDPELILYRGVLSRDE